MGKTGRVSLLWQQTVFKRCNVKYALGIEFDLLLDLFLSHPHANTCEVGRPAPKYVRTAQI